MESLSFLRYDVQGFQVVFTETVATRYETSAAQDGMAAGEVCGGLHDANAPAELQTQWSQFECNASECCLPYQPFLCCRRR
jgi:hypothetical protein